MRVINKTMLVLNTIHPFPSAKKDDETKQNRVSCFSSTLGVHTNCCVGEHGRRNAKAFKQVITRNCWLIAAFMFYFLYISHSLARSESSRAQQELIPKRDPINVDGVSGLSSKQLKADDADKISNKQQHDESTTHSVTECPVKPYKIRSGKGSIIALASFPGSGNTWVRHLIQRGSGFLTGSVYKDGQLRREFPREGSKSAKSIVVKTHYPTASYGKVNGKNPAYVHEVSKVRNYNATVQILRNPFDAIVSEFNYWFTNGSHTNHAPKELFESSEFDQFVMQRISSWVHHASFHLNSRPDISNSRNLGQDNVWLDANGKPVLLVYYEDLKSNTQAEMTKMFRFIKRFASTTADAQLASLDPEQAGFCSVATDSVGNFHRKAKISRLDRPPIGLKDYEASPTLRTMICSYAKKKAAAYWKTDDPSWSCDPL